ncbi:hypothetical protein PR202_ga00043 [Eleusine coracana subsp. coracana]|uniref:Uncharacterized protein n=1 Tax=Eleusine coracana subsp. coracana TaxID=191504 RepID=A0AAV5BC87_ELECO|nr:hypothetical protein PR202_ga00043 [Eleusine coracana subsp. coracana]
MANSSIRRGLNSDIILGPWTLWKHRNDCVFNGAPPSVATTVIMVSNEARLWNMVGAKGPALVTGAGGVEEVG